MLTDSHNVSEILLDDVFASTLIPAVRVLASDDDVIETSFPLLRCRSAVRIQLVICMTSLYHSSRTESQVSTRTVR